MFFFKVVNILVELRDSGGAEGYAVVRDLVGTDAPMTAAPLPKGKLLASILYKVGGMASYVIY